MRVSLVVPALNEAANLPHVLVRVPAIVEQESGAVSRAFSIAVDVATLEVSVRAGAVVRWWSGALARVQLGRCLSGVVGSLTRLDLSPIRRREQISGSSASVPNSSC